ncbi:DUF6428 family protein [Neolewinella agarilytica]|uniref:Uncharacterized protein n=1 Tax=Neolewinella agarilytica TaxID=478744 RepID=A0A1H9M6Y7_9BACT|nr:DUF6428 family protein [Neolewinella agarilytica]SER19392.1 hypothetical protein SAMN05444359_12743 [Neolewinella agarilytica]
MLLSELKSFLSARDNFLIRLPDGNAVESHFHVTEVGEVTKHFIDCGGKVRRERVASLQLWSADDYNHRLEPGKLVKIVGIAERELGLGDLPIEVEYQGTETIQKFNLEAVDGELRLQSKTTACLALEECGFPVAAKKVVSLAGSISKGGGACTPGGGCC